MSVTFLTNEDKALIDQEVSKLSEDIAELKENGTGTGNGATTAQANSLWAIIQKSAFAQQLTDAELTAFKTAWGIGGEVEPDIPDEPIEPDNPEVTLTSISATYTGGEVAVGTSVNSLTGITVKATYSDGSTKTVTGYTLSGTIVEGSNTITVSYGGKTTTFTVTGIAEGTGGGTETVYPASEICTETGFLKVDGISVNTYNGYHSDYIPVEQFKSASVYFRTQYITSSIYAFWFYDENKTPISGTNGTTGGTSGISTLCELTNADIPVNTKYIVISVESNPTPLNNSTITLIS